MSRTQSPYRRSRPRLTAALAVVLALAVVPVAATPRQARAVENPAQYVNPFIGTDLTNTFTGSLAPINGLPGWTYPGAQVPFGMFQFSPHNNTDTSGNAGSQSYRWDSDQLIGFGMRAENGFRYRFAPLLPYVGTVNPATSPGNEPSAYYDTFSHANEDAEPGYYRVNTNRGVGVELTATNRAGIGRFTYPAGSPATMIVNVGDSGKTGEQSQVVNVDPANRRLSGYQDDANLRLYFTVQFDRPFVAHGTFDGDTVNQGGTSVSGSRAGGYLTFDQSSGNTVEARVGVSLVSEANALGNINAEISGPGKNFGAVRSDATAAWNAALGKIEVDGGATEDYTNFYTGLYHALQQPNVASDTNGQYRGWDGAVRQVAPGRTEYTTFTAWDQARGHIQLLALLYPRETSDMMQSMVDAGVQTGGWIHRGIIGNKTDDNFNAGDYSMPAVAYAFGARDYDTSAALDGLVKTANDPNGNPVRPHLNQYLAQGYVRDGWFPTDVSLSLAASDFAISRMALSMGRQDIARSLLGRSDNWRQVFDPTLRAGNNVGYVWDRREDGRFEPGFGPDRGCRRTGDIFEEGSSAHYSFWAPHDLDGVITAMDGRARVVSRLDEMFTKLNDGCETIYGYMGNEPQFFLPWVYNWAGQPARTQDVVRRTLTDLFGDRPSGLPGNDDWGAMGAFYVWSAIGLYPQIPGVSGVAVHSPLFATTTIHLGNGRTLRINGNNASRANRYVQSLRVDGTAYDSTWLPLAELADGATLDFNLGASPTGWGSTPPVNPPPSFPFGARDMALGVAPATGSSTCGPDGPGNATDGSPFTKWCAYGSGTYALKVDLGSPQRLSRVTVQHAAAGGEDPAWNTRDFRIQWSADGSDSGPWNDLVNVTGNRLAETSYRVAPTTARYVRLLVTAPEQGGGGATRIYGFEVEGRSDLAIGASTSSASPSCNGDQGPGKATDGSPLTKWCAYGGGSHALNVDLGGVTRVTGFGVRHAGFAGEDPVVNTREFRVQSSPNGTDQWADLTVRGGINEGYTYAGIDPTNVRYLRLLVTDPEQGDGNAARIYEFEVYGD